MKNPRCLFFAVIKSGIPGQWSLRSYQYGSRSEKGQNMFGMKIQIISAPTFRSTGCSNKFWIEISKCHKRHKSHKSRKNSWKFVYILAKQCSTPSNLTIFFCQNILRKNSNSLLKPILLQNSRFSWKLWTIFLCFIIKYFRPCFVHIFNELDFLVFFDNGWGYLCFVR